MRRILGFFAVTAVMALAAPAFAAMSAHVTFAPLSRQHTPPPLGRKQGWLVINNHDWMDYSLHVDYSREKLYLYRQGQGYGSVQVPSGSSVTLALPKDNWDLYGDSSNDLKVRIREGKTTTLSLEPFGYVGNTGLNAVVNDGERIRSESIFNAYTPPVVVQPPPPPVVVQPPPVIVQPAPPPIIINRPPLPSRPGHRPPPPSRPGRRPGKNNGWGFSFFFD